jgi:hypothetical protein
MWVEQTAGGILEMTSASIDLPRFGFTHSPQFHQPVIPSGD